MNMKITQRTGWLLVALMALLVAVECHEEQLVVESRQQKESPSSENELADTIKYLEKLEKLDQYWSEVARPRFGRSEYKQPLVGLRFGPSARVPLAPSTRHYGARTPLAELINARLAARYNSNDAY